MPYSQDRPRRPSDPSPPCNGSSGARATIAASDGDYRAGVLGGYNLLVQVQHTLCEQTTNFVALRRFRRAAVRAMAGQSPSYCEGLLDVLALYVQLSLDGHQIVLPPGQSAQSIPPRGLDVVDVE